LNKETIQNAQGQNCKNCKELENKIIILSQQNKTLEQELQESKQRNLYLMADFENYKKHIDKNLTDAKNFSNEKLLKELLNIVDDFERALTTIKDKEDLKGITLVYNNLMKLLNSYEIKKIDSLGKQLDPNYHEVLLQEESNKPEGEVIEELQKGYIYKNKVLRYAKVKVSQNKTENKEE